MAENSVRVAVVPAQQIDLFDDDTPITSAAARPPENGPPRARTADPHTSKDAAAKVSGLRPKWAAILRYCEVGDRPQGWIADEIAVALGAELGSCPWKRVSEVLAQGWIEVAVNDAGEPITRPGRHSASAAQRAYRITASGRARLREAQQAA